MALTSGYSQAELTASFLLNLRSRGVLSTDLLRAFEQISRTEFVGHHYADLAQADIALPIPCGQTQTSPGAIARMLSLLDLQSGDRVLEIGTGSGYAAALIAQACLSVTSFERYRSLCDAARARFRRLAVSNVVVIHGDGRRGDMDHAPFDKIIVHGALSGEQDTLLEQLSPGGAMVGILLAGHSGELTRWRKPIGGKVPEMDHFGRLDLPALQVGLSDVL
jgi:protein-L-isoaspartate(D-aspartate) O-methyltransferase